MCVGGRGGGRGGYQGHYDTGPPEEVVGKFLLFYALVFIFFLEILYTFEISCGF